MFKIGTGLILIFSTALVILGVGYCQEVDYPQPSGYINDFANVISAEDRAAMSSLASQIENKTTAQVAVVTVATIAPLTIEQYAVELFEKWGIGQKGKDNGILILMAVNDRKIRIETGYGLEGALPDAVCNQIIYQAMMPEFRKGDLSQGLLLGTIAVAEFIAKEYNITLTLDESLPRVSVGQQASAKKSSAAKAVFYLLLFILLFGLRSGLLFFWILGPTGRRRGGYWYGSSGFGGGGFSGGFGGFGGGFSGGGGASGGW